MRILAETRNRKHSKELFKEMREHYGQVEILGYYDSPEDYVSGNLASSKFEIFEEEKPFDGGMNIQYNMDRSVNETSLKRVFRKLCSFVQTCRRPTLMDTEIDAMLDGQNMEVRFQSPDHSTDSDVSVEAARN